MKFAGKFYLIVEPGHGEKSETIPSFVQQGYTSLHLTTTNIDVALRSITYESMLKHRIRINRILKRKNGSLRDHAAIYYMGIDGQLIKR